MKNNAKLKKNIINVAVGLAFSVCAMAGPQLEVSPESIITIPTVNPGASPTHPPVTINPSINQISAWNIHGGGHYGYGPRRSYQSRDWRREGWRHYS